MRKESNDNHAVDDDKSEAQRSKPKKSVRWRERLEETSGALQTFKITQKRFCECFTALIIPHFSQSNLEETFSIMLRKSILKVRCAFVSL